MCCELHEENLRFVSYSLKRHQLEEVTTAKHLGVDLSSIKPPVEGTHRPNTEEGQLYAGISTKEHAYQQQWHQSCNLFNTCST